MALDVGDGRPVNEAGDKAAVGLGGRRNRQRAAAVEDQVLHYSPVGQCAEKAPGLAGSSIPANGLPVLDGVSAAVEMALEGIPCAPCDGIAVERGDSETDGRPVCDGRHIDIVCDGHVRNDSLGFAAVDSGCKCHQVGS